MMVSVIIQRFDAFPEDGPNGWTGDDMVTIQMAMTQTHSQQIRISGLIPMVMAMVTISTKNKAIDFLRIQLNGPI